MCLLSTASDEDLGSSEESGKDWDELEEEAKKGLMRILHSRFLSLSRSAVCHVRTHNE